MVGILKPGDVQDIIWLQDANHAQTSSYDLDGQMTWDNAVAWADQLVYGGYDDWRLPQTLPVDGVNYNYLWSYDGSTDIACNISAPVSAYPGSTGSEMAYMYYVNLGNLGYFDTSGSGPQESRGLSNTGPFINVQSNYYWSGTECVDDPPDRVDCAWHFGFFNGSQGCESKDDTTYAWAVRDGDVSTSVPEPATMLLLGSGLIGLLGFRRKFRKK